MAKMQGHLDEGCQKCAKALHMWRSLVDLAAREPSYEPPANSVRLAKAAYTQHMLQKPKGPLSMVANLIFDSLRQPMPAGVRASQAHARQLLYAAGDYLVDVRVEGGSKRLSLVGQIMNSSKPGEAIKSIPVALLSGNEPVAQAITSPFGEFEFEFEAGKDQRLVIGLDADSSLVIPLQDIKPPVKRVAGSWPRGSRSRFSTGGRHPFRQH